MRNTEKRRHVGRMHRNLSARPLFPLALLTVLIIGCYGRDGQTVVSEPKIPATTPSKIASSGPTAQPEQGPPVHPDSTVEPQAPKAEVAKELPATLPASKEPKATATKATIVSAEESREEQPDPTVLKKLVGEWTGYFQGKRHLKVASDGTGTMQAEPEGLAAKLLAAKLKFDIRWKLKGKLLEFETIGGEPLDKINVVVKMYGRLRRHKLIDLTANQIVLLDEDGVTKYIWKRAEPAVLPDSEMKRHGSTTN